MTNTGNKDTRSGFGAGLYELGTLNPNVVALCADLTGSLKMEKFAESFPGPVFQNRDCRGQYDGRGSRNGRHRKNPLCGNLCRVCHRQGVRSVAAVCLLFAGKRKDSRFPCRHHPGRRSHTHQTMEDPALARALPHMTVVSL